MLSSVIYLGYIFVFKKIIMKTLDANGMKILKICHILCGIMWIGGVMALVSIMLGTHPIIPEQIFIAARDQLIIDEWFLIPGGVGIVITSIVYSFFTKWGFSRFRWIEVKWILTIILVVIGKAYMGVLIERNMEYAKQMLCENISSEPFFTNVYNVAIAGIVQLIGFMVILILSVVKPWNRVKIQNRK